MALVGVLLRREPACEEEARGVVVPSRLPSDASVFAREKGELVLADLDAHLFLEFADGGAERVRVRLVFLASGKVPGAFRLPGLPVEFPYARNFAGVRVSYADVR